MAGYDSGLGYERNFQYLLVQFVDSFRMASVIIFELFEPKGFHFAIEL